LNRFKNINIHQKNWTLSFQKITTYLVPLQASFKPCKKHSTVINILFNMVFPHRKWGRGKVAVSTSTLTSSLKNLHQTLCPAHHRCLCSVDGRDCRVCQYDYLRKRWRESATCLTDNCNTVIWKQPLIFYDSNTLTIFVYSGKPVYILGFTLFYFILFVHLILIMWEFIVLYIFYCAVFNNGNLTTFSRWCWSKLSYLVFVQFVTHHRSLSYLMKCENNFFDFSCMKVAQNFFDVSHSACRHPAPIWRSRLVLRFQTLQSQ